MGQMENYAQMAVKQAIIDDRRFSLLELATITKYE
jgi:hypothetical protein